MNKRFLELRRVVDVHPHGRNDTEWREIGERSPALTRETSGERQPGEGVGVGGASMF